VTDPCPFGICEGDGFVVDEATNTAAPCRCRAQRISLARSRSLSAVIPKRFRGVGFDRPPVRDMDPGLIREIRQYVNRIDDELGAGRGLWFQGDVGTGKTTLAMLVSRHALEARHSVAIYSLPRLLAEIRMTFDEGAERSYVDLLDRLAAVDLVHLDDVGAEKTSEWVLEQLYAIINQRYEEERAVMITTNLDPDRLAEQIGTRTVSRLFEMCGDPIPMMGEDRRTRMPDGRVDAA
jgi:DNA replication protein DnaC